MSTIDDFVARVFSMPGDPASCKLDLHPLAARAMQSLILRATQAESCRAGPLSQLTELLDRLPTQDAHRWLTHPLFFSSLHGLSPVNPVLDDWHQQVATPNMADVLPADSPRQCTLGNLLLPLLPRDDPAWCGELILSSDALGRLRFPHSNRRPSFADDPSRTPTLHSDDSWIRTLAVAPGCGWFIFRPDVARRHERERLLQRKPRTLLIAILLYLVRTRVGPHENLFDRHDCLRTWMYLCHQPS